MAQPQPTIRMFLSKHRDNLKDLAIIILHRRSPDQWDKSSKEKDIEEEHWIWGPDLKALNARGVEIDTYSGTEIPYHRVLKVVQDGIAIWERYPAPPEPDEAATGVYDPDDIPF